MNVFAVHASLADEVRPTQAIFTSQDSALSYATVLSTDTEVLAASVVRFTVDELGTGRNLAMFVDGRRQQVPHVSDCRSIHGGGRGRY